MYNESIKLFILAIYNIFFFKLNIYLNYIFHTLLTQFIFLSYFFFSEISSIYDFNCTVARYFYNGIELVYIVLHRTENCLLL